MAKPRIFTGARAIVKVNGQAVGLFANCSWSIRQDKAPAYILGRFNPAEITSTSQEPVTLSLTGYRVVGAGPYEIASGSAMRKLSELLNDDEDFAVTVEDRRDGTPIFTAQGCRMSGWSSGVAARGVSDVRLDVIGLVGWDESSDPDGDDDTANASNLTDGTVPV
jgi:hypothetical protein